MRRLAAWTVLAIVLGGCARQQLTLIPEGDLPGNVYESPEPSPPASPLPRRGVIYLVERGRLSPVNVTLQEVSGSLPEALLSALFVLSEQQTEGRAETEIPPGTRLNGVDVESGVAIVDVSGEFEAPASARSQALRIAQVVYTLTEEGTRIHGVRFEIEGFPQQTIGGRDLGPIAGRVTRVQYAQFEPQPEEGSDQG
jgi:hypothetical protein